MISAGVHDSHVGDQAADDSEVMANVYGRHPVGAAEAADRVQHVALGRDVESGRRLVKHDERWPAGEGHRQRDALLLAAGQLMRVAAQHLRASRQAEPPARPRRSGRPGRRPMPGWTRERLRELRPDAQGGIERRSGVLRHVGDLRAPYGPQLGAVASCSRSTPSSRTSPDLIDSPRRAWPSSASATVVFPIPTHRPMPSTSPARTREGDVADYVAGRLRRDGPRGPRTSSRTPACGAGDMAQAGIRRLGAHPASARAEVVERAPLPRPALHADRHPGHRVGERVRADREQRDQQGRGTITAQGLSWRPIRFSLIIVPQLGAGGGWPKPRKRRPAMITIE